MSYPETGLIEIKIKPGLKDQQRPNQSIVDLPAAEVILQNGLDRSLIKQAMPAQLFWGKLAQRQLLEVGLQPSGHRTDETLLAMREYLCWQQRGNALFQQIFFLKPLHLEAGWYRGAIFQQLMIDEGRPHFQRIPHAHSVGAGQDILGQISLDVAVKNLVERVFRVVGVENIEEPLFCCGDGCLDSTWPPAEKNSRWYG